MDQAADALRMIGKPVVTFYVGGYDPAGVLIDVAIERELRQHLNSNIDPTFRRLGITQEQIEPYDLATKPRKLGDRRSLEVVATVEAEAMPAATLRSILRSEIESWLPTDALMVAKVAEESERCNLNWLANLSKGVREDAQVDGDA